MFSEESSASAKVFLAMARKSMCVNCAANEGYYREHSFYECSRKGNQCVPWCSQCNNGAHWRWECPQQQHGS